MANIIVFFIIFFLLLGFQYFTFTKLTLFQYCEMSFGALFIIVFFGFFGAMLTLNKEMISTSIYASIFFMLWYYITKKIVNGINSDINGVIYFS
jgi:hypothetical protein